LPQYLPNRDRAGPWPDAATARSFLDPIARRRVAAWPAVLGEGATRPLAGWLIEQELGPPVFHACRDLAGPAAHLARWLHEDYHKAMAEAGLQQTLLGELLTLFSQAALPAVLLKGAAMRPLYGKAGLRTMSDLDLWLPAERMAEAVTLLQANGYVPVTKDDRPPALQQMSQGEVQLCKRGWRHSLVELHWFPFSGWWLQRTAVIDHEQLWARKVAWSHPGETQVAGSPVYQLAPEDAVIHLAVHLAINHQFAPPVVRNLMDIVLTAQMRAVDWRLVAARARAWRVATAVWLALRLAEQLLGLEGAGEALTLLRPTTFRRRLLRRFVSVPSVLAGRDLRHGRWRFLLLLLLVDRPLDAGKLMWRTVWPENEWLIARYGHAASRRRHLWGIVARGQV
jgi:hypothetical protein